MFCLIYLFIFLLVSLSLCLFLNQKHFDLIYQLQGTLTQIIFWSSQNIPLFSLQFNGCNRNFGNF